MMGGVGERAGFLIDFFPSAFGILLDWFDFYLLVLFADFGNRIDDEPLASLRDQGLSRGSDGGLAEFLAGFVQCLIVCKVEGSL